MSAKNLDTHNRWRNKTVAFRVSPEENEQIDAAVRLSGLTKQDYITKRLLCRDVVVQGNPRVYKALRNELAAVLEELERIEAGNGVDGELLDTIRLIAAIMDGSSARVVDTAVVPSTRSSPSYTSYTARGMLLGLVLSCAYVALRQLLDDRVQDEDYLIQNYPDIPVLAVIPDLNQTKHSSYGYYEGYGSASACGGKEAAR